MSFQVSFDTVTLATVARITDITELDKLVKTLNAYRALLRAPDRYPKGEDAQRLRERR